MLLSNYVKNQNIISELSGEDKDGVIKEMGNCLATIGDVTNKEELIDGMLKREEIESTAIGNGIAIPHTRGEFCKNLLVCIARSKQGVDFNAIDGKPVFLIFMIAAPETAKKEYLQVIAKIARFLKSENNKKNILYAETKDAILQVIGDFDATFPGVEKVTTKDGRVIYKEMT